MPQNNWVGLFAIVYLKLADANRQAEDKQKVTDRQ
jgi:hypothetical protein